MIRTLSISATLALSALLITQPTFADEKPDSNLKTAQEIRAIIPAYAAMRRADFNRMATADESPRADHYKDQSLTLMLFTFNLSAKKETKQFRWLTENLPKPATLAEEINRGIGNGSFRIPTAPVSMIQADRITRVTCEVKGETASGVVTFKVPQLYEGEVSYVAKRADNKKWKITEFVMTDLEIHLVRDARGLWKQKTTETK